MFSDIMVVTGGLCGDIPLRRFGRAEEVAAWIAFLAADEVSFVNGANLLAEGGVTAITGHSDVLAMFGMGSRPGLGLHRDGSPAH